MPAAPDFDKHRDEGWPVAQSFTLCGRFGREVKEVKRAQTEVCAT